MDHELSSQGDRCLAGCIVRSDLGCWRCHKRALCLEFAHDKLRFERERHIPLRYRDAPLGEYQVDLIVEKRVVVEVKSVLRWEPVFEAQILTYLRITGIRVGLLMNFNKGVLKAGIKRFVL
jgi:GxxExxY protein